MVLSENYHGNNLDSKGLIVKHKGRFFLIKNCDILFGKALGNISLLLTRSHLSPIPVSKNLGRLHENLIFEFGNHFIRCHKSYLVNQEAIVSFCSKNGLICVGDILIPISQKRFNQTIRELLSLGFHDMPIPERSHRF